MNPRARRRSWPARSVLAAALLVLAVLTLAAPAGAVIDDPVPLDGPSADIVGLDGVAMASDGTGGAVYRKRVDGRVHIFAARFTRGKWSAPIRVDVGQKYESSFPAIGAGPGGRLVVVWCQQYGGGTQNRLFSAAVDPGAKSFLAPIPFDLNVGDGADLAPSLQMNTAGQAFVVYRVITNRDLTGAGVPAGYVQEELRLARYDGSWWTPAGTLLNRNPSQPMLGPTADNGPKVAIDDTGNGLVAWQEPDDAFVARVWARRVFSGGVTVPLPVSPVKWPLTDAGLPLNGPADAISVAMRGLSEGAVAFRQQPSAGGVLTDPRTMVNLLPAAPSQNASAFLGAMVVDGGTDAASGLTGGLGAPDVSVSGDGAFDVALGAGSRLLDGAGGEGGPVAPVRLDDGTSPIAPQGVLDRGEDGALAAAWKIQQGSAQGIQVLERRADGTPQQRLVSAPTAGDLGPLLLSGSGFGDAAIAFQQGTGSGTVIMGGAVDAPPSSFTVSAPIDWTRAKNIAISWDPPASAISTATYGVLVDDQDVADDLKVPRYVVKPADLPEGRHTVSVIATDAAGQPTAGTSSDVLVDRTAPKVTLRVKGRTLSIAVKDARGRSGASASATRVSFGDRRSGKGHTTFRHRYRRAGTYRVTVRTADKAGNKRTTTKRMRVR